MSDNEHGEDPGPNPDVRANIRVVLCHPSDSRNVGACIRAVVNHGIGGIRVVSKEPFDPEDLFFFSAQAIEQIEVEYFTTLDAALEDCNRVVGTSRRIRDEFAPPFWPAAGVASRLTGDVITGLLFGTERTGLTKEESDRCEALIQVPTSESFPSMNLGHAVAVLSYELARPDSAGLGPAVVSDDTPRASSNAREGFYRHVWAIADELAYPPGRNATTFTRKLRRILDRANMNEAELSMVAGIFSEMKRLKGNTPT